MTQHILLPATLLALALLSGCNTVPPANTLLEDARRDYRLAQDDPMTRERAAAELQVAGEALQRADNAWSRKEPVNDVDHWAYLARQQVAIARATAERRADEQASQDALATRDQIRLNARTSEADLAQRNALLAQQNAQAAQLAAQVSQDQSAAARQAAEVSRTQADAARLQANSATLQADEARRQRAEEQARADALEVQLRELNARQTDRGLVITIGDMLFATDTAQLRPGGLRNVDKLADFMKRHPRRSVLIEGFTDSRGSDDHNQILSEQRADAVRNAIVDRGVEPARLATRGYGEAHPVAGNESSGGRQLNRRVEIVLSDAAGAIIPR
jgi:outer membrane protein OmpA-like peptidoglycan-associated protein